MDNTTNDTENVFVDTDITDYDKQWIELQDRKPTKSQSWVAGIAFLGIMIIIALTMVFVVSYVNCGSNLSFPDNLFCGIVK